MTMNREENSGDIAPIAGAAFRRIQAETKQDLSRWIGPRLTTGNNGDYKVEWRPADDQEDGDADAVLTIYADGVWGLYADDGSFHEGRMMVLHDRRWVHTLKEQGINGQIAISSHMFYKEIAEK